MRRIRSTSRVPGALWLLSGLVTGCALAGFMCLTSLLRLDTHIVVMSGHIGFSPDWSKRFPVGERLALGWDRAMPRGYERLYLHQDGEIIGSLPESPSTARLREALAAGQAAEVKIVELDRRDPVAGLRVGISIGTGERRFVQPVAVQALNGAYSLL